MRARLLMRPVFAACLASCLAVGAVGAVALGADGAAVLRTDHAADGNRVASGRGPVGSWVDIELEERAAWILPSPSVPGADWIIATPDGRVLRVSESGRLTSLDSLPPGVAPVVELDEAGEIVVSEADAALGGLEGALPDARLVTTSDGHRVALTDATARSSHGVLGDELEAASLTILGPAGSRRVVEIDHPAVIEGIAPIAADLDSDGADELIVTVSDDRDGARLRAYATDGSLVAESQAIGRGFRWRHQIGAGAVGPDGEIELLSVRTPHIGGIVEAFRLVGDRLELVATAGGFSSHRIGSANLDMALLADVDGDDRLELVVPTDEMTALGVLRRTPDGFEVVALLPLGARLVTNVAATMDPGGGLVLAAGTDDGRLRVFR